MQYATFLTTVTEALKSYLGSNYGITLQKIPKNNGTLLDGLCISKTEDSIAPTIYLNGYYERFTSGTSIENILNEIIDVYTNHIKIPPISSKQLEDFSSLRSKVVYKLIHTQSNQALLPNIPHIPYLDLSIVFYLFLEENAYGHMTALIHNCHVTSWETSTEELFDLASQNTPLLLPADLKNMTEVMRELAIDRLGDDYQEDFINELISEDMESPLYVLTNRPGLNGACTILYQNLLKNFADSLKQDLVILPSSIHEVLLIPYDNEIRFEELSEMVTHINQTEVPPEDQLSNAVYYFSRSLNLVTVVSPAILENILS